MKYILSGIEFAFGAVLFWAALVLAWNVGTLLGDLIWRLIGG